MEIIKIAIIEDELFWQGKIRQAIESCCPDNFPKRITCFFNAADFLKNSGNVDIAIFDVELKSKPDGLSACKMFKEQFPDSGHFGIILTSHQEFIKNGYRSEAFRFLDKGAIYEDLRETFKCIFRQFAKNALIKLPLSAQKSVLVRANNIIYLESSCRKVAIHLRSNNTLYSYSSFMSFEELLSGHEFFTINRGIMVNLLAINNIDNDWCFIHLNSSGAPQKLPVSRRMKNPLKNAWMTCRMEEFGMI